MIVDNRRWTEDRLIEAMWAFKERTGVPPKVRDFNEPLNELPSYDSLRRIIGDEDYNDYCCRTFGLKNAEEYFTNFLHSRGGPVVFIRVSKIVKEFKTHLDPIYLNRWITKRADTVIGGYRINRYKGGSVYKAVWDGDDGECPQRVTNSQPGEGNGVTKADVIQMMWDYHERYGKYPSSGTMSRRWRQYGLPSMDTVYAKFNNAPYNEILNEAFGVPTYAEALSEFINEMSSSGWITFRSGDVARRHEHVDHRQFARWLIQGCTESENGLTVGDYIIEAVPHGKGSSHVSTTFRATRRDANVMVATNMRSGIESVI